MKNKISEKVTSYVRPIIRIDWRCPNCRTDNVFVVLEKYEFLKCGQCQMWHSAFSLKSMRSGFAPHFPDGKIHSGYVGAVRESDAKPGSQVEYAKVIYRD